MACKHRRRRAGYVGLNINTVFWLCIFFLAATCCYHTQIVFSTYEVELKTFEHAQDRHFRKQSFDDVIADDAMLLRHKRKQLLDALLEDMEEASEQTAYLEDLSRFNLDAIFRELQEAKAAESRNKLLQAKPVRATLLQLLREKFNVGTEDAVNPRQDDQSHDSHLLQSKAFMSKLMNEEPKPSNHSEATETIDYLKFQPPLHNPAASHKQSKSPTNSSFANPAQHRLPEAIIIGVKKAGTRALLEYLRMHPMVVAPGPEPHFFDKNYERGLDWYRSVSFLF